MRKKSVVTEAREIQTAIEMIHLGARLQLLENETNLSRERLIKLYKELKGVSPPKGMLPFSADWFLTWQPNIHSSVFIDIHQYLIRHADCRGVAAIVKSYKLYLEHCEMTEMEPMATPAMSLRTTKTALETTDSRATRYFRRLDCMEDPVKRYSVGMSGILLSGYRVGEGNIAVGPREGKLVKKRSQRLVRRVFS